MYEELRKAFIKRLTVTVLTMTRGVKTSIKPSLTLTKALRALTGTDLDMVLEKFDAAVRDLTTYQKR